MLILLATAFAADADPFRPSGSLVSGTGTLQGESPFVLGKGLGLGVFGSFAQNLAVQRSGDVETPLFSRALPVELYGGFTEANAGIRFEAFLPLYLYTETPGTGYQGPALGDLRIQANIPILRNNESFGLGVVPRLEIPAGTRNAYVRRGFQIGLTAAAGGKVERFGWLVNTGVSLSEAGEIEGVGTGSTFEVLGGGWYEITPTFRVGAEAEAQVGFVKRARGSNTMGTWHVYAQPRLEKGLGLTVGAGRGLINGVGAPSYRVFAALTFQLSDDIDTDKDGILDDDDACPNEPEDFDSFQDEDGCPEADNDNDTLVDLADACPNDPEDFDGFQDDDGCPDDDNDTDGILDADDACPDVPGVPEYDGCPPEAVVDTDEDGIPDAEDDCPEVPGLPEFKGCPDRDGDKVPDPRDLCPDVPIPAEEDPATSDGCPKTVFITKDQIRITKRIKFDTGSDRINPLSFYILDQVAELMVDNPSIRKIEIGGHTDNVGSDSYNQRLSEGRAGSVRTYLLGKGVSRNRVVSKGYGETTPRDTNRTDAGRANNRRVEFKILLQDSSMMTPTPPPAPTPSPEPSPTAVPKPGPTVAPKPGPTAAPTPGPASTAEPTFDSSDLTNPWDTPPTPTPQPAPGPQPRPVEPELTNPWGGALSEPTPAEKPAPLANPWDAPTKPQPTDKAKPEPESNAQQDPEPLASPWDDAEPAVAAVDPEPAVDAPEPIRPPGATADPDGAPGRMSILLKKGSANAAVVYLDNEVLQRMAPIRSYPLRAGEHHVWVRSSDGAVDERLTFTVYNGMEATIVVPAGGPPSHATTEVITPATPEEKPSGRRSKKRKKR